MTTVKASNPSSFHNLETKSVPHILEKIFFSLDIQSFDTCRRVSGAWRDLLDSEAYKKRYEEMLAENKNSAETPRRTSMRCRWSGTNFFRGIILTGFFVCVAYGIYRFFADIQFLASGGNFHNLMDTKIIVQFAFFTSLTITMLQKYS